MYRYNVPYVQVYVGVELYDLAYWGKIHYSTGDTTDTVRFSLV